MVTLALMLFLLFSMILDLLCWLPWCLRWYLQPVGCQVLLFDVAAPIISMSSVKRRLQTSQPPIEMAVFCSLRISCMIHSGQTVNRTRESKHPIWRRKNSSSWLFRITRCWDCRREPAWLIQSLHQCYRLVLFRDHHDKLCRMPSWMK